jgi:diguanylate cyclase (GGDEF)-like protein
MRLPDIFRPGPALHASRIEPVSCAPSPEDAQGTTGNVPAVSHGSHDRKPNGEKSGPHGDDQFILPERGISLEDLPTVLLAKHNELDRLLNDLNQISLALKSNASPDIQGLSESLMRAVRGAVRQSLLDKELCTLALIDDLTGLHNRRGFLALAGQQLKQAHRNRQELLLFSGDLDNLKQINDSYGHQEGDAALVRTSEALRHTFRNSDILSRFGGDEFSALALEASVQNERTIIGRLNENLKHANAGETRYSLSLSIGVARFDPRRPATLDQLMEQADQEMYSVKRARSGKMAAAPSSE